MDRFAQLAQLRLGVASGWTDRSEEEGGRCSFQAKGGGGHELVCIRGRASQRWETLDGDPPIGGSEPGKTAGDLGGGIG
jgi:hypothetical protein